MHTTKIKAKKMSFYTKGKVTDCLIDATRGCLMRSVYRLKSLIQTITRCLNGWRWISGLYFIQHVLNLISSAGKYYSTMVVKGGWNAPMSLPSEATNWFLKKKKKIFNTRFEVSCTYFFGSLALLMLFWWCVRSELNLSLIKYVIRCLLYSNKILNLGEVHSTKWEVSGSLRLGGVHSQNTS